MIYLLKRLFLLLLVALLLLWTVLMLPPVKRTVTSYVRAYIETTTGLSTKLEQVDLFFPFVIRLHDLSLSKKGSDQPLIKCQRLSLSPLLFDLPFGRLSILRLRSRGLYCDGDGIEKWFEKDSDAPSHSPNIWLHSFSLRSVHLVSSRLPFDDGDLDFSLRGSLSSSDNGKNLSLVSSFTQKTPNVWPKQVDLSLSKRERHYDVDTTLYLSTRELPSAHRFVFDHDDTLSLSLSADLLSNVSLLTPSTLEKIEGSWELSCPTSRKRAYHYALETSAHGRGTIHFVPGETLTFDCESFRADICSGAVQSPPEELDGMALDARALVINSPFQSKHTLTITTRGTIQETSKDPDSLLWTLSLPSITINGVNGQLSGNLSLCPGEDKLLGIASAEGALQTDEDQIPIRMMSEASFTEDDFSIVGDLSASSFHGLWDIQQKEGFSSYWSSFRCRDLSLFKPFIQYNISGRAELSSRFTKNAENTISVSGNISDLTFGDLRCGNASLSLSNDTLAPEKISIIGDLATGVTPLLGIDRSHLSATYNRASNALDILEANIVGELHGHHLDLSGSGSGQIADKKQSITIDHLQGMWGKEAISLENPLLVERKKRYITLLQGSILLGQQSRVSGSWKRHSLARATGDLSLERVPAHLLFSNVFSNQVVGYLDGQCHYQALLKTVEAKVQINSELVRPQTMGMPRGNIAVGALLTIHNNVLETEICAAGTGIPEPVVITAKTKVSKIPKTPYVIVRSNTPVRGNAKGDIHLSEMFGPWMPAAAYFDGVLGFDVNMKGSLQKPLFSGPVSLHEGRIDLLPTAEVLTDIEVSGTFSKQTLVLNSITASDGSDGHVRGTGKLMVTPFQWSLDLHCSDLEFISLSYATIQADGSIQLNGTNDSLHISGSAKTKTAIIDLAVRFPTDVPEIEFSYKHERKKKKIPFAVSFDLAIDGSKGLEIKGRGLQSLWTGTVRLKGKAADLIMDGHLRCKEGSFTLANKELTINSGTISVAGNLFRDSRIDVLAITALPSITARAALKGSLAAPKLSVQSTPPRTDNEILSLLLFNKEYGEMSPLESLQLANIAISLEHSSGPFQLIDRVKQTVGIDVIDIGSSHTRAGTGSLRPTPILDTADGSPTTTGQNDVSLRVGKYISNGVIVSVSRDISSDANRVGISAPLINHITAEAEVGDDEVGIISIKWKRDY